MDRKKYKSLVCWQGIRKNLWKFLAAVLKTAAVIALLWIGKVFVYGMGGDIKPEFNAKGKKYTLNYTAKILLKTYLGYYQTLHVPITARITNFEVKEIRISTNKLEPLISENGGDGFVIYYIYKVQPLFKNEWIVINGGRRTGQNWVEVGEHAVVIKKKNTYVLLTESMGNG